MLIRISKEKLKNGNEVNPGASFDHDFILHDDPGKLEIHFTNNHKKKIWVKVVTDH